MGRMSRAERRRRRLIPTVYGCFDLPLRDAMWKPTALPSWSKERRDLQEVQLARRWIKPLPPLRAEDIW